MWGHGHTQLLLRPDSSETRLLRDSSERHSPGQIAGLYTGTVRPEARWQLYFRLLRGGGVSPTPTLPGPGTGPEVVRPEDEQSALQGPGLVGGRAVSMPSQAYDRTGNQGPGSPTGTCPLVSCPCNDWHRQIPGLQNQQRNLLFTLLNRAYRKMRRFLGNL